jgi:hypothetical protein
MTVFNPDGGEVGAARAWFVTSIRGDSGAADLAVLRLSALESLALCVSIGLGFQPRVAVVLRLRPRMFSLSYTGGGDARSYDPAFLIPSVAREGSLPEVRTLPAREGSCCYLQ